MSRRIAFYKMVSIVRGANTVRRELGYPIAAAASEMTNACRSLGSITTTLWWAHQVYRRLDNRAELPPYGPSITLAQAKKEIA